MCEEDYCKAKTFSELYEEIKNKPEIDSDVEGEITTTPGHRSISYLNDPKAHRAAIRIRKSILAENPSLDIPSVPASDDPLTLMDYCTDAQRIVDDAERIQADLANSESAETDSQRVKFGFYPKAKEPNEQ